MDRLDELAVLTAILDAGSLAGAARRLRRSPPAISRSLAALEGRAGARLIQRTSRQLMPTAAGRRLAARARQLLGDYDQTMGLDEERRDAPLHGLLRITGPTLFGRLYIAPLVSKFLGAHPGVRVELALSNRNLDLVEESLDLALRIGPLSERGVIAHRVGHVRRVLFASPGYLTRRGSPRSPRDLTKHDIVYVAHRPSPTEWRFRAQGREQVVRLAPRFMVSDIDTAILAAKAGSGIARALSYQVASDFSRGTLVRVLREFEPAAWPVNLVVPTAQHMPRMVRAFLDMAAPALEALQVIHDERR